MAIKIKFDEINHTPLEPTLVLAYRNGDKIAVIPHENLNFRNPLNSYAEMSFRVYKYKDSKAYDNWDALTDFKLVWVQEWNKWFEIQVEINETNNLIKNVIGKSLGESELSQTNLYNIEINTETDISRDDYVPTVFFNASKPKASLLHRILSKTPNYTISANDVPISLRNIQRTFSFDNTSVYDALMEVAEELNCLIEIVNSNANGTLTRKVVIHDLEAYCSDCGYRGEFENICPKCNSANIMNGYGNDTNIFISNENLSDEISYSTDVDSVKNCFKLEAGDELMTSTIAMCNPNGSNYIWYISDEQKSNMSQDLKNKINAYDTLYESYQNNAVFSFQNLPSRDLYNNLIDKYNEYIDYTNLPPTIIGYQSLISYYYDSIDFELFLTNRLAETIDLSNITASDMADRVTFQKLSPVSIRNLSNSTSESTVTNAVLAMVKTLVYSNFKVSLNGNATYNSVNKKWSGSFTITNYDKEDDEATCTISNVSIVDNLADYVSQELKKSLAKGIEDKSIDIVSIFELGETDFKNKLKEYGLSQLNSFRMICQTCIDILIEQGIANKNYWSKQEQSNNLYNRIYSVYYNKLGFIDDEISVRESEIKTIVDIQNNIKSKIEEVQADLDFQKFISKNNGESLWIEFISHRREDTYENNNYISDGLNNSELIKRALEFLEVAKKEIVKSATLQHSIQSTLKNLLVIKEFEPLVDNFVLGNYIRIKIDSDIYRLRLIEYEIDYDDLENISVTFSDVMKVANGYSDIESILSQAASMATSYPSVSHQASKGNKGNQLLADWVDKGLSLTNMKIINDSDNQNFTIDSNGILGREYYSVTDSYDDKQLKIINKGLYLTNDNWKTAKAGIGNFIFYNPLTQQPEEAYGVIADTLVGNLILSEEVGIYNPTGSITLNDEGFKMVIDTSVPENQRAKFKIQTTDDWNTYNDVIYFDSNGNAHFKGKITATELLIGEESGGSVSYNTFDNAVSNIIDSYDYSDIEDSVKEAIKDDIDGKSTIHYDTNEPTDANENDLWVKSISVSNSITGATENTYELYRYTKVDDVLQWVKINDTTLTGAIAGLGRVKDIADGKIRTYAQDDAPVHSAANPLSEGDLWIDTNDNNCLYRWHSGAWKSVRDSLINTLSDKVDGKVSTYYSSIAPEATLNQTEQGTPNTGDLWFNTKSNEIRRYNSTPDWNLDSSNELKNFIETVYGQLQNLDNTSIKFYYQTDAPPNGDTDNDIFYYDKEGKKKLRHYNSSASSDLRWSTAFSLQPLEDSIEYIYDNILYRVYTTDSTPVKIYFTSSTPTGSVNEKDIWYNIVDNEIFVYSKWTNLSENLFSDVNNNLREVMVLAETAKNTADSKIEIYTMSENECQSSSIIFESGDLWINTDKNNELNYYDGKRWNVISNNMSEYNERLSTIENNYNSLSDNVQSKYDSAVDYATKILNDYTADISQYMSFDPTNGLTLSAKNSNFKTIIDNKMLRFTDNGSTVAYISNKQLNIEEAIVKGVFILGNFAFVPHSNDSGFSISYKTNS